MRGEVILFAYVQESHVVRVGPVASGHDRDAVGIREQAVYEARGIGASLDGIGVGVHGVAESGGSGTGQLVVVQNERGAGLNERFFQGWLRRRLHFRDDR